VRAVTFHAAGDVRVDDVPEPTIERPTDALVRVTMAAICGTDLHVLQAGEAFGFAPGTRLGHEFLGTVEAVGGEVTGFRAGDRVMASVLVACGVCQYCREGLSSSCVVRSSFGWAQHAWTAGGEVQGGQSELARVPLADGSLQSMPAALAGAEHEPTLLPLIDVMSTAWHGLVRAGLGAGQGVVVIGDGAVGLSAVHGAAAREAAPIICLGHHADRLAMAERLGVTATIDSRELEEIRERVMELTGGEGAHAVIDTVSNTASMATAHACVRAGGAIATLGMEGFKGATMAVDWFDQFLRNITITGGYVPGMRYFADLLALAEQGRIEPSPMLTTTLPLERAVDGYRMMAERAEGVIKVALRP
jgi:threonine dehydrogenase-like Zn-dependent dehydrogenase